MYEPITLLHTSLHICDVLNVDSCRFNGSGP